MKNLAFALSVFFAFLLFSNSNAQIPNSRTVTEKVSGNCGMCKTTIEDAGNMKKIAMVTWDQNTKMVVMTYNTEKTTSSEILKRIALAGYDNSEFLAPDDTYAQLHACCKYERVHKSVAKPMAVKLDMAHENHDSEMPKMENSEDMPPLTMKVEAMEIHTPAPVKSENGDQPATKASDPAVETHDMPQKNTVKVESNPQTHTNYPVSTPEPVIKKVNKENQLKPVFEAYFALKDQLVATNGEQASSKAKNLLTAINVVKMESLPMDVHMEWMKVVKNLTADASKISGTKDIGKQRTSFISLSKNMYDLIKVSKFEAPVYYQFCPMANDGKGANWLSKENAVKNPYYGSQMLSCGKTVETINK